MGYCTECGARLPEDASFCTSCGAPVRPARRDGAREEDRRSGAAAPPHSDMGYDPRPGTKKKNGDGKIAAIVITVVVILFAAAGYLLDKAVDSSDCRGYWESSAIEVNGAEKDSYLGNDINGLFGIEVSKDGTATMGSAFTTEVYSGSWRRSGSGIVIYDGDEEIPVTKKDGKLRIYYDGLYIIYSRAAGNMDHPSVAHGSLADGGGARALPSPGEEDTASGAVGAGSYSVAITGAQAAKNADGDDTLRIYFTYTNHSEYSQSAWDTLKLAAEQNGKALEPDDAQETTDEGVMLLSRVRPEVTVQCCYTVDFDPNGGEVGFAIVGWDSGMDGGRVHTSFTPGQLPGAPQKLELKSVAEPKWTAALPAEGAIDDYEVSVTGAELVTDADGEAAVRILYRFENNSGKEISMDEALRVWTYQDGVSLQTVDPAESRESDDAYTMPVEPGANRIVSCVFRLRNSSSQIEAEVETVESYDAVGQTYAVKG